MVGLSASTLESDRLVRRAWHGSEVTNSHAGLDQPQLQESRWPPLRQAREASEGEEWARAVTLRVSRKRGKVGQMRFVSLFGLVSVCLSETVSGCLG